MSEENVNRATTIIKTVTVNDASLQALLKMVAVRADCPTDTDCQTADAVCANCWYEYLVEVNDER
jgi:hypothetical protein